MTQFKCGYVGLVGRPNAGKSTLLNRILGSKLAITSAKPQTTRNRIVGVHNEEGMQAILVDTPGIHKGWTELNRAMVQASFDTIGDVDVICWLVDVTAMARRIEQGLDPISEANAAIADQLAKAKAPLILVANKMDIVPRQLVLPVIDALQSRLTLAAAVPISALTGDGVERVLSEIKSHLSEGPALYPEDQWTEVSERFLVAEIIREKIFQLTEQEIPYSTFVEVERFDEKDREDGMVRIYAAIVVEKKQQKGIVIGRGGDMLKQIGTLARKDICELLQSRVYLELFVKVEANWSRSRRGLRKVGFE